jgi:hypothetical protein
MYEPGENLVIDETIIGFRGRAPFRVFMPAKPKKFGLKVWMLVDPLTNYVYNMKLYTGKPENGTETGLGEKVFRDQFEFFRRYFSLYLIISFFVSNLL